MQRATNQVLEAVAAGLNDLPGVFSTAQWGGRAYKLPGPGGNRNKPKLLAFVSLSRDGSSVVVTFKLPKPRAAEVVSSVDWIARESFGSLGAAGWVQAKLTTRKQANALRKLLAESRALYPVVTDAEPLKERDAASGAAATSAVARRIARVMQHELPDGWSPPQVDDFVSDALNKAARRRSPSRARRHAKAR